MTSRRAHPYSAGRRPRRFVEVTQGVLAAVALVVVVVGLPLALRIVSPVDLPDRVPSWDTVLDSLTHPDDGGVLRLVLTVVAWTAWACFAGCVVLEVVSVVRRRATPQIPLLRLPQHGAASLVAAVLLLGSSGGGVTAGFGPGAAPSPGRLPVAATTVTGTAEAVAAGQPLGSPEPATRSHPRVEGAARMPTVVVRRHDTLWGLAERHLSSGLRYREIVELNRGREQPDGRRLTDPHWIYPGWVLRLPLDATGHGVTRPEPVEQDHVRRPPAALPPATVIVDRGPVAPTVMPPLRAHHDSDHPSVGATAASGLIMGDVDPAEVAPLVALGLGAITVAGVVAEIGRQRRAQQRVRRTGSRISSPALESAAAERLLRAVESDSAARRVRVAMRLLALGCAESERPVPKVEMVRVGPEKVQLLLAEDDRAAVVPFEAAGPRCWQWHAAGMVDDGGRWDDEQIDELDVPDPCPALLSVGADGPDLVLVNLEAAGTLRILAAPQLAEPVLDAFTIDLTNRTRDAAVSVSLVAPRSDGEGEGVAGASLPTLTDEQATSVIESRTQQVQEVLSAAGVADVSQARSAGVGEDAWPPHVVVGNGVTASAQPWSGTAVVATGDGPGWGLRVEDGDSWLLEPAGLAVVPQRLDDEGMSRLRDLLDPEHHRLDVPPDGPYEDQCDRLREQLARMEIPDDVDSMGGPRLLLLGPIEVRGASDELIPGRVRRATELVAYLALRPGATRHELDEVMWPGRRVTRTTRNQFVSRARLWLGRDERGVPHLPLVADEGSYRLQASVSCDWYDFVRLARRGLQGEIPATQDLAAALDLVRARPLLGVDPASYSWADDACQLMVSTIVDVAHLLSVTQLAAGKILDAARFATRGLLVEPASETLHRDAIRAAGVRGDGPDLRRAVTRMRQSFEALGLGDDLMPETLALLGQLGSGEPS